MAPNFCSHDHFFDKSYTQIYNDPDKFYFIYY